MKNKIKEYFETVSNNFKLLKNQASNIENAANLIITALENKNKIIFCGNGGSAADSQHLSAELMGRYKINSTTFHIEWYDWKLLLIENNIKTVNKKSPWEGMREYSVSFKGNKLILTSITGKQSWELDKKSLVYRDKEWGEEKDEVKRYWKRIKNYKKPG